jgi:ribosomal protein S18 acetylase RimI-like enzyme
MASMYQTENDKTWYGRITVDHNREGTYLDWRQGSGDTVEIYDIAVYNEDRRQGKGRALVDALIDRVCPRVGAKKVFAITKASNRIAQEFYEELRFRAVPLWNFYGILDKNGSETVDAIMYIRDIGSRA